MIKLFSKVYYKNMDGDLLEDEFGVKVEYITFEYRDGRENSEPVPIHWIGKWDEIKDSETDIVKFTKEHQEALVLYSANFTNSGEYENRENISGLGQAMISNEKNSYGLLVGPEKKEVKEKQLGFCYTDPRDAYLRFVKSMKELVEFFNKHRHKYQYIAIPGVSSDMGLYRGVWDKCMEEGGSDELNESVAKWWEKPVFLRDVETPSLHPDAATLDQRRVANVIVAPTNVVQCPRPDTRLPEWSTSAQGDCEICGKSIGGGGWDMLSSFSGGMRHHCRKCGRAVCGGCSKYTLLLRSFFHDKKPHKWVKLGAFEGEQKKRVCKCCYEVASDEEKGNSVTSTFGAANKVLKERPNNEGGASKKRSTKRRKSNKRRKSSRKKLSRRRRKSTRKKSSKKKLSRRR